MIFSDSHNRVNWLKTKRGIVRGGIKEWLKFFRHLCIGRDCNTIGSGFIDRQFNRSNKGVEWTNRPSI